MDATYQEPTTFGAKELHKRKRTKRQRSQSLSHLPSVVVSDKPTRRSDSVEPAGETEDRFCNEEEDMANCLMLLARGGLQIVKNGEEEEEDRHGNDQNDPKFSSKRYVEDSGYFVYQCKTCDKSFPSFQALGGHRASHKKPKIDKRPPPLDFPTAAARNGAGGLCVSDDDDVLALQLMMNNAAIQKPPPVVKVHECSICGAEFSSGQALGGHMRRHRPPPVASSSSLTPPTPESEEPARNKFGSSSSNLDLDLNLPAPEDDQESGSVLSFESRSGLVLSIPAMVGCHY